MRLRGARGRKAKVGLLAAVSVLALAAGLAGGGTSRAEEARKSVSLTLAQAVGQALENSQQVQLAQLAIDRDKLGIREASSAARRAREAREGSCELYNPCTPEARIGYDVAVEIGPDRAKDNLAVSERNLEAVKRQVRADVEKAYFGALLAQEAVKVRQEALSVAQEQLRLAQVGLQAGVRARPEVLAAEVQVVQAQTALRTAEKDRDLAFTALRQKLGLPADTGITLADALTPGELPDVTVDAAVQQAIANSIAVFQLQRGLAHQGKVIEIVARYLPGTYRHRKELFVQKQLEIQLEDLRNQLELGVRRSYMDMVDAYNQIAQYDKAVQQAEENLRLQRLRYEAGVGTGVEVEGAAAQLTAVRLQRLQAVYTFRISRSQFDLLLQGTPAPQAAGAAPGTAEPPG